METHVTQDRAANGIDWCSSTLWAKRMVSILSKNYSSWPWKSNWQLCSRCWFETFKANVGLLSLTNSSYTPICSNIWRTLNPSATEGPFRIRCEIVNLNCSWVYNDVIIVVYIPMEVVLVDRSTIPNGTLALSSKMPRVRPLMPAPTIIALGRLGFLMPMR